MSEFSKVKEVFIQVLHGLQQIDIDEGNNKWRKCLRA